VQWWPCDFSPNPDFGLYGRVEQSVSPAFGRNKKAHAKPKAHAPTSQSQMILSVPPLDGLPCDLWHRPTI